MSEEEPLIITEETPPEAQKKEPTKVEQFAQKLRAYSTEEEAKAHITEIAQELGCAKSLGYKALKHIKREGGFSGEQTQNRTIESKEPTARIEQAAEIPLEETQAQETAETVEEEVTTEETALEKPLPLEAEALQETIEIFFQKVAGLIDYPDFALTPKEAKSLSKAWLPVLHLYLPQLMTNPLVWAGIVTAFVFLPRVFGYFKLKSKKKKEKPVEPPNEKTKAQEPQKTEPPTEPQKETETPLESPVTGEVAADKKPKTAGFMKDL
jgi:transposase-like protein